MGALVRNLAAAIATALAWIALIEGIAGQLLGNGPGTLAALLRKRSPRPGGRNRVGPASFPNWGAGLVLAGYAAVFATAAVVTTLRRDVT